MANDNPIIENPVTEKSINEQDRSKLNNSKINKEAQSLNDQLKSICNTAQSSYRWLDTGYSELNSILKTDGRSNGWPLGTTIELGVAEPGIGELRLFFPALQALVKKNAVLPNILLINPPYEPCAQALEKAQLDPAYFTVVNTNNKADTLWAAEQALSANCCAAVFTWTNAYPLSQQEARRLQLATEKSGTLHALFRHKQHLAQSSFFRLKIELTSEPNAQLKVTIAKQPLSWGGQQCVLSLAPHYENWQRIDIAALPVSQHVDYPSPTQVKVLAKAKRSGKILAFTTKQVTLAKVS